MPFSLTIREKFKDFIEWAKPWYPVKKEITGFTYTDCFGQYFGANKKEGKRFVDKYTKRYYEVLYPFIEYVREDFEREHGNISHMTLSHFPIEKGFQVVIGVHNADYEKERLESDWPISYYLTLNKKCLVYCLQKHKWFNDVSIDETMYPKNHPFLSEW